MALTIPDSNIPFGENSWRDANKVKLDWCFKNGVNSNFEFCNMPSYLYVKYKPDGPDPRLFLFSDATYVTNTTNKFGVGYNFDTEYDGNLNYLENPDDIFITLGNNPNAEPPLYNGTGPYQQTVSQGGLALWISTYGGELAKGIFRWNFGPSENSRQSHFKAYAEIPMTALRKYPNRNDPSRIGFNMVVFLDSAEESGPKFFWNWEELSDYDVKMPELIFTTTPLVASITTIQPSITSAIYPPLASTNTSFTTASNLGRVFELPSTGIVGALVAVLGMCAVILVAYKLLRKHLSAFSKSKL